MAKPKNAFKEWLETENGKLAMQPHDFTKLDQLQYLENRLWWAYTSGVANATEKAHESPSPDGWVRVDREFYDAVYSIRKNFELWKERGLKNGVFSFHLQNNLLTIENLLPATPADFEAQQKGGEG